jgi:hypothetical protein
MLPPAHSRHVVRPDGVRMGSSGSPARAAWPPGPARQCLDRSGQCGRGAPPGYADRHGIVPPHAGGRRHHETRVLVPRERPFVASWSGDQACMHSEPLGCYPLTAHQSGQSKASMSRDTPDEPHGSVYGSRWRPWRHRSRPSGGGVERRTHPWDRFLASSGCLLLQGGDTSSRPRAIFIP